MEPSVSLLCQALQASGISYLPNCDLCGTHSMEHCTAANHYKVMWRRVDPYAALDYEEVRNQPIFWQSWLLSGEGGLRFNHLDGVIEVFTIGAGQETPAYTPLPKGGALANRAAAVPPPPPPWPLRNARGTQVPVPQPPRPRVINSSVGVPNGTVGMPAGGPTQPMPQQPWAALLPAQPVQTPPTAQRLVGASTRTFVGEGSQAGRQHVGWRRRLARVEEVDSMLRELREVLYAEFANRHGATMEVALQEVDDYSPPHLNGAAAALPSPAAHAAGSNDAAERSETPLGLRRPADDAWAALPPASASAALPAEDSDPETPRANPPTADAPWDDTPGDPASSTAAPPAPALTALSHAVPPPLPGRQDHDVGAAAAGVTTGASSAFAAPADASAGASGTSDVPDLRVARDSFNGEEYGEGYLVFFQRRFDPLAAPSPWRRSSRLGLRLRPASWRERLVRSGLVPSRPRCAALARRLPRGSLRPSARGIVRSSACGSHSSGRSSGGSGGSCDVCCDGAPSTSLAGPSSWIL